jgi:tight adherence protein B
MEFGQDLTTLAFVALVGVAVFGVLVALLFPLLVKSAVEERVKSVSGNSSESRLSGIRARLAEDSKDGRRRQIQDSLKQLEDREKERKKKVTLRTMIAQAGLDITVRTFWMISALVGLALGVLPALLGAPAIIGIGTAFVGFLGLPRWVIGFLRRRRQNIFINDFADAIDVMVRGLKAGLPVSDAMKIIAAESGEPVGPEFMEVVEGQRVGISIDQGIERMVDRIPLAEVNFLAIVMAIQSKTGGNLSEALNNLSRVLRDRKRMKAKIRAVSQEAKASAAIIGSLPFVMLGLIWFVNPDYLSPLFETRNGNIMLFLSGVWMSMGVLVMRKMINFDF